MADEAEDAKISQEEVEKQHTSVENSDVPKSATKLSSSSSNSNSIPNLNVPTSDISQEVEESPLRKQQTGTDEGNTASRRDEVDDAEQIEEPSRTEDEYDIMLDEMMDSLDVVDSWVDAAEECTDEPSERSDTINDVNKDDCKKVDSGGDRNRSSNVTNQKRDKGLASQGKKNSATDGARNNQDKKIISRESVGQPQSRTSVRRGRSPDSALRKRHPSRDGESTTRKERSPNRSSKPSDNSRRNSEKGADHGNSSSASRRQHDSKTRRSRSRDREAHYNSKKNERTVRNYQTNKKVPPYSSRTTSSSQKRGRSMDQDRKKQSLLGKEATKKDSVKNTEIEGDKKKHKSSSDLIPPGTEDDAPIQAVKKGEDKPLPSQVDGLVPPGTEDILLPNVVGSKQKEDTSSSKKRKLSGSDSSRKLKPSKEREISRNDKDKERQGEKKRRVTSTGDNVNSREFRTNREQIARDQDRISRELSLERLRESRNRDRLDSERYQSRGRYSPSRRSRVEETRRSTSFGRQLSGDSRWETSGRVYRRRRGDLSPISPGRMSRGSPISFEFSPVSSRSSSRERLRTEYQRSKFRSYSPISSGSDLSRSMIPYSSDEEREPRSRRRRRLPFLDEMERKLGLKLTGGHNINQKLRSSQQIHMGRNIDMSAPPPGTYPARYPPPVSYPTPFPGVINPVFPAPTPPFVSPIRHPPVATKPPPRITVPVPPPVVCPPASTSQTSQPSGKRQLVTIPREPLKSIPFKFQRPIQKQPPEVPEAPPPPAISAGTVKPELSLSSILEASVKVGGKNPVDEARLQRCQVAIQTLQEDESFSMVTLGRFVVQPEPNTSRYCAFARFDHPAQESMFKLKSPLLRNQPANLKFTTPSTVPSKNSVDNISSQKDTSSVVGVTRKSSIWPKNSERMPPEKKDVFFPDEEEECEDDPDVCIVENLATVVSISSESDHDMNLSLVSDFSDVSADESGDGDDKLENVSSGEEDFNQCSTCVECNRVKNTVNASTQYENLASRSVQVQVDFVREQLVSTCEVPTAAGGDKSFSLNQTIHSNASSISSYSSNELTSSTPTNRAPPHIQSLTDSSLNDAGMSANRKHTAQSFLESVSDLPSGSHSITQASSNQGSSSSSYKPFMNKLDQFTSNSSQNLLQSRSNIDSNKTFQDIQSSSNPLNYSGSMPFRSLPFSTLSSGIGVGSLSSPLPARGILKTSLSIDKQSTLMSNVSATSSASSFRDTFKPMDSYLGGKMGKDLQSHSNNNAMNRQGLGMPPFPGASTQQQPLYRNQSAQNQQSTTGQLLQSGSLLQKPYFGSVGNSQQSGGALPFHGNTSNQSQLESGRPSFQGSNMLGQPFAGSAGNQNRSFQSSGSSLSSQGPLQKPFLTSGTFGKQTTSASFGSIFGNTGSRPALTPQPVPAPAFDLNFPRPSGGPGVMNREQQQTYFNSASRQPSNYYER